MKNRICMLTTIDNPYDPFEDFDSWLMFDNDHGYGCCSLLARIGKFADTLTDQENYEEQERAIDEIIKYDIFNIYKKVVSYEDVEEIEDKNNNKTSN